MRVLGSEAAASTRERRPFLLQHPLVSADKGEQGSPGQKNQSAEDSGTIAAYKRVQRQMVPKKLQPRRPGWKLKKNSWTDMKQSREVVKDLRWWARFYF